MNPYIAALPNSSLYLASIGFIAGGFVWPVLRFPWWGRTWGIGEVIWTGVGAAWAVSLVLGITGPSGAVSFVLTVLGAVVSFYYLLTCEFRLKRYEFQAVNLTDLITPFAVIALFCIALVFEGVGM
jgi:hypothetical protein